MQHPRDPFSSDDSAEDAAAPGPSGRHDDPAPPPLAPLPRRTSSTGHQPGGAFSRPHSSPRPPDGPPPPRPAPAATPEAPAAPPAVPPEAHHAEAVAEPGPGSGSGSGAGAGARAELPPEADDAAFEPQILFESWEPPGDLADPMWDVPFRSSAPGVELDREPEYAGARAGAGGPPPGPAGLAPRRPMSPPPHGPWNGPRHARHQRGHWGGVILALTGALALAGAVPIGILGVRTLTQPPVPTVTTAPLANGSPISAPPSVAAAAPSQLSQAQTAVGPAQSGSSAPSSAPSAAPSHSAGPGPARSSAGAGGETTARAATFAVTAGPGCRSLNGEVTWPFHAPTGDGWHPAAATRSGPCGTSFSYSLLANVRNDSGSWHDHFAWIFHTGKTVASCTLSVYVPPSQHATGAAFYWFSAGSDDPENRMADFTIDQKTSQGQWVTKGPFTFPGGTVLAEVTDRGVGPASDSVEASAVQLRCV